MSIYLDFEISVNTNQLFPEDALNCIDSSLVEPMQ